MFPYSFWHLYGVFTTARRWRHGGVREVRRILRISQGVSQTGYQSVSIDYQTPSTITTHFIPIVALGSDCPGGSVIDGARPMKPVMPRYGGPGVIRRVLSAAKVPLASIQTPTFKVSPTYWANRAKDANPAAAMD
jgi:hypothetical protein